jgi:N-acetylneuraminic acid mutarotase
MLAVSMGLVESLPQSPAGEGTQPGGAMASDRFKRVLLFGAIPGSLIILGLILTIIYLSNNSPANQNASPGALQNATQTGSRWQVLAPMPTARYSLAVAAYENSIFAFGGLTESGVTSVVERYDTSLDAWVTVSPKPLAVYEVSTVVIGGKIYIPGGRLESGQVTDVLEIYDPQGDLWSQGAPIPLAVSAYALAAFEGRMYLFGGWDGQDHLATVYEYDPENDAWILKTAMPTPRSYSGAAVAGRKIFVMGGYDGEQALAVNEIYNPENIADSDDAWVEGSALPEGVYGMGVTSVADIIYLVGGEGAQNRQYSELAYFQASDEWQSLENDPVGPRAYPGLTNLGLNLYVLGGLVENSVRDTLNTFQAAFTVSFPIIVK